MAAEEAVVVLVAVAAEEAVVVLVAVEEEGAVVVDDVLVAVEKEGAVVVDDLLVAAVEEEGAVAACVDVEVWLGAPKSSTRRPLFGLLPCMVLGNFLLPGMFFLKKLCKNFVKTLVKTLNHTHGDLTSTMQATKMQRARSFLYTSP